MEKVDMVSTSIREGIGITGARSAVNRGGVYYRSLRFGGLWSTPNTQTGSTITNETLRDDSVRTLGALLLALKLADEPVETTTPEGFISQFALRPGVASKNSAIVTISRQPGHQAMLTTVQEQPKQSDRPFSSLVTYEPRVATCEQATAYAQAAMDDIIAAYREIPIAFAIEPAPELV